MTDEDDELKAILAKDIDNILKYFENHLDEKFTLHGVTLITLIFKSKVNLLTELHNATREAMVADLKAKAVIETLMRKAK